MGLDGVELIMEVEDQFGIRISDEEASQIHTVADLYYFILQAIDRKKHHMNQHCPSRSSFYRMRRVLTETFGVPRHAVRRRARMDDLLPRRERRAAWNRFRDLLRVRCPGLRRPTWMSFLMRWGLPLILFTVMISAAGVSLGILMTAAFLTLLVWAVVVFATKPLATCLPSECATVESMVRLLVAEQKQIQNAGTAGEVWLALRHIIAEQLGIAEEETFPESRFVEDLNVG